MPKKLVLLFFKLFNFGSNYDLVFFSQSWLGIFVWVSLLITRQLAIMFCNESTELLLISLTYYSWKWQFESHNSLPNRQPLQRVVIEWRPRTELRSVG